MVGATSWRTLSGVGLVVAGLALAGCGESAEHSSTAMVVEDGTDTAVDTATWTQDEARRALLDQLYVCDDGIKETATTSINGVESVVIAGFHDGYQYITADPEIAGEQLRLAGYSDGIVAEAVEGSPSDVVVGDDRAWVRFGAADDQWYTAALTDEVRTRLGIAQTCDLQAGVDAMTAGLGLDVAAYGVDVVAIFEAMPVEIDSADPHRVRAFYGESMIDAMAGTGVFTRSELAELRQLFSELIFDVAFDDQGRLSTRTVLYPAALGMDMRIVGQRGYDFTAESPPADAVELSESELTSKLFDSAKLAAELGY